MLRKTVIGLIKNGNEVDGVLVGLHGAGIPQGSIKVLNRQELERHESEFQGDTDTLRRAGLRGTLKRIFGAEPQMDREHESPIYTEWIRSGGTLIAVNTDESHAGRVNQILANYAGRGMTDRMRAEALRGDVDIVDLERGKQGRRYFQSTPAYEYGSALAADPRYRNRDWADVMPEARRNWEARGQGSWNEVAEAVREGWENFRRRVA